MTLTRTRPSLRLLQIFQAAADQNSFGDASRHVSVSQPAVSQSIKRLEALLGVTLFDRGRTGYSLSECGAILHLRSDRLFNQIELALSAALATPANKSNRNLRMLTHRVTEGHIRALAAIDETGSIAHAARKLGMSQPSVQRAARDLEHIINRPLYSRTARGLSTTPVGTELARCLQTAVRELDYALDEIEAARDTSTTRLSIGALPLSCTPLLATTINQLAAEFPHVHIAVTDGAYDALLRQLRSGRLDMLFGVLRWSDCAEDVTEWPLFNDAYAIVVRPSHPLARKKRVTIDDLSQYEWLAPAAGVPRRRAIEALFAGSSQGPLIGVETHSLPTQKALLAVSDRITILTRREGELDARRGLLNILEIGQLLPRRPDGLATRKDWRPTPFQQRFIELIQMHAREFTPPDIPAEPSRSHSVADATVPTH